VARIDVYLRIIQVLPASLAKGTPFTIEYTASSLKGVRVDNATVKLGAGKHSITIKNAPINIITQKCVGATCASGDVGYGIIGVNYHLNNAQAHFNSSHACQRDRWLRVAFAGSVSLVLIVLVS